MIGFVISDNVDSLLWQCRWRPTKTLLQYLQIMTDFSSMVTKYNYAISTSILSSDLSYIVSSVKFVSLKTSAFVYQLQT